MNLGQLRDLKLERKWPRLTRLLQETASLEKRLQESEALVQQLQGQLESAREKDLGAEAKAVRAGKDVPEAKHEPAVQKKLERATRDAAVMHRALEAARADLTWFLQKHRGALLEDVQKARAEIASEVAQAAQEALVAYSRHEDLFYVLKDLQPPPDTEDYNGPPAARSQHFLAVQTTSNVFRGPERGRVEEILRHLISLGAGAAAEAKGDADAA